MCTRQSWNTAAISLQLPDLPGLEGLTLPIDGYIRVSRVGDRSGASYISPDIQRSSLERWAQPRNVTLHIHDPEENVSGGTMDRPIFNEIMRRLRHGASGGVVVYKLDRFARTLVGGMTTLRELTDLGAIFASATEPLYDMTTADGRMVLQFNLMMAEYFRERATETWSDSLTHAVGRGVHISPSTPYGYDKDASKRLVPNASAPFVYRAFQLRVEDGLPFQRIADWLNANAPARPDGRAWVASSVERMIRRRVYLGVAHWGAVENPQAHAPLVGDDLWTAAQHRIQARNLPQWQDAPLLHGIARCAGCRFQMSRALNTSGGYRRYYYRCRVRRVSGTCAAPASVRAEGDDGLEAVVERAVCVELDRRAREYTSTQSTADLAEALAALQAASVDVEELRADALARRRLGDRWLSFLEPLLQAEEAAQARVDDLRTAQGAAISGLTSHGYEARSRSERAEILRSMIDVVFVRSVGGPRGRYVVPLDADRVRILYRGQGPNDLPLANRVSPMAAWPWPEGKA